MIKIPTLFLRDYANRGLITRTINPDCQWVTERIDTVSVKHDGVAVRYDGVAWWARRQVKAGKLEPENFVLSELDENTGTRYGWEPIGQSSFYPMFVNAALQDNPQPESTFELCGPRVNGNRHRLPIPVLIPHGVEKVRSAVPRTFDGLELFFSNHDIEGLIFEHPDGRRAKIKHRDFLDLAKVRHPAGSRIVRPERVVELPDEPVRPRDPVETHEIRRFGLSRGTFAQLANGGPIGDAAAPTPVRRTSERVDGPLAIEPPTTSD